MTWELFQPHVVGQTRKLIFGATTLQNRALIAKLTKRGLTPSQEHIDNLRKNVQKKIKNQEFITKKDFEILARKIVK